MNRWIRNHGACSYKPVAVAIGGLAVVLLSLYVATNCIEDTRNQQMALLHQSRIKISDLETQLAICNTTWQGMEARFECNVADLDITQWRLIQMKSALEEALETLEVYKERERERSNESRSIAIEGKKDEIARMEHAKGQSESSGEGEDPLLEAKQSRTLNWVISIVVLLITAMAVLCHRNTDDPSNNLGNDLQVSDGNMDGNTQVVARKYPNAIFKFLTEYPGRLICRLRCSEQTVEYVFGVEMLEQRTLLSGWCDIPQWMHGIMSRVQFALECDEENVQEPPAIPLGDTFENVVYQPAPPKELQHVRTEPGQPEPDDFFYQNLMPISMAHRDQKSSSSLIIKR